MTILWNSSQFIFLNKNSLSEELLLRSFKISNYILKIAFSFLWLWMEFGKPFCLNKKCDISLWKLFLKLYFLIFLSFAQQGPRRDWDLQSADSWLGRETSSGNDIWKGQFGQRQTTKLGDNSNTSHETHPDSTDERTVG
jgi:hypothetical protein